MFMGTPISNEGGIQPLKLVRSICETPENVRFNVERTLSAPYVRFNEFLGTQVGPVSIVGSGPSLARHYQELTGDVVACNGAHDYLIERGIVPRFCMIFDASPVMKDFITPHKDVIYLIASRCHEALFKHLEGCKIVVWHCKGDDCIDELLEERKIYEPMIHGGSAAVMRAVFLVIGMGFKDLHLFGADSSFEDDQHHIGKTLVPENMIEVWNGRWFKSTGWMAGQVEDFRDTALILRDKSGIDFTIHGSGLFSSMARALGFTVIGDGVTQILEEQNG